MTARQTQSMTAMLLLCVVCGCKAGYRPPAMPYDSAASLFEKANLSYEVDAGALKAPVAVARIEGQQVSYDQLPSTLEDRTTFGRLEIEYPHPGDMPGYALARVTVKSKFPETVASGGKESLSDKWTASLRKAPLIGDAIDPPTQVEEVWELDLPRVGLDRAIAQLNQASYFERESQAEGPVKVTVKIDGQSVDKTWQRVPELDALMMAARSRGRLLSYKRSASAEKLAHRPPASIDAYRHYARLDSARGATGFAAAGSAAPAISANPQLPPPAYPVVDPRFAPGGGGVDPARIARLPGSPYAR